jgi:16S rRNA processing protein RimM
LAKIVKEWGVRGEVKALPLSQKIFSLVTGGEVSLLNSDGIRSTARVTSMRKQGRHFIVAIEGCFDPLTASSFRGSSICVPRDSVVLEENEFFCDQLIGISVVTPDGETIGRVAEIFETGSNDVYVVKAHDREYLLPAIWDVIQEIDLGRRRIIIKTMPGLLD